MRLILLLLLVLVLRFHSLLSHFSLLKLSQTYKLLHRCIIIYIVNRRQLNRCCQTVDRVKKKANNSLIHNTVWLCWIFSLFIRVIWWFKWNEEKKHLTSLIVVYRSEFEQKKIFNQYRLEFYANKKDNTEKNKHIKKNKKNRTQWMDILKSKKNCVNQTFYTETS